MVLFC